MTPAILHGWLHRIAQDLLAAGSLQSATAVQIAMDRLESQEEELRSLRRLVVEQTIDE